MSQLDKDSILETSRAEKSDEGVAYAENKGRRYGVTGFCAVFIILMVFNLFTGQNNFVPYSLFFAYLAAEALGRYGIQKQKSLLITTVFGAIASILFVVCHILEVLGLGR